MKALLSVFDKSNIVQLCRNLVQSGFSLVSTGGTYDLIVKDGDLPVDKVADLVDFPEILGGRVKTLHPKIHGGLLALRNRSDHMDELVREGIETIDLVVVNLYPFVETVRSEDAHLEDVLENIDIGGPSMLRAAAKNFPFVTVLSDPDDYLWVSKKLQEQTLSLNDRRFLAYKAFRHVSMYDAAISQYLCQEDADKLPEELTIAYKKIYDLRYGENPHQKGSLYASPFERGGLAYAKRLHGKELSFNNILDADSAWSTVVDYHESSVVVVKHTNPCGLASHEDLSEAYRRAYQGDPISAYGGIVGFNRTVTEVVAKAMEGIFYEVIVAPGYSQTALDILKKRPNVRILEMTDSVCKSSTYDLRPVRGGLLVQTEDIETDDDETWRVVTDRSPNNQESCDLGFAWKAVRHVKSNAIVLAKDLRLIGMGAGQPNRVTSVHLALKASKDKSTESVLASDAFFPFPDGIELAASGGVTAVIQPGGSIRDQEIIDAANANNIAMVFTGTRHFRH